MGNDVFMTTGFMKGKFQIGGMTLDDPIASVLSYLDGQINYAVVGRNAVAVYVPEKQSIRLPFEVIGAVGYLGIVPVEQSLFFDEAIIRGAQQKDASYKGKSYRICVANQEDIVALSLADKNRPGEDASILLPHYGLNIVRRTSEIR